MKKITDFIIDKRYFILIIFIILSIISVIVSKDVVINYDISRYLPKTSETRKGIDIMEDEFEETTSTLNLMIKDLSEEKKDKIYNQLKEINGVSSVDYENNENYNKDGYTLYVLTIDDVEDSKLAKEVYDEVTEKYEDYEIYTSGNVSTRNAPVLPLWIMALAVGCALIILLIMCESYVEPFLFLFVILMAVLLNKGTNIIFSSVSNITDSICAILQMALSMDYSIMLINRYRQEREKEENKIKAMKEALYNSFKSISSSSVTTIVGLAALIFMTFTIGRDLGLVLAKGVLFSLICIFFVLPALILMCDTLIKKTAKKSPIIKLNTVGKISHKLRYIAVPIFIGVFIFSFLEKGNLGILYTSSEDDKVAEVFGANNQMAVIYKNKNEDEIAKYLDEIEKNDKVKELLGYSNTINQELKYDELKTKLNDLGSDVTIEDYLMKTLYYHYYNQNEDNKMSFNEFVSFIKTDIYSNQDLSNKLSENEKKNIDLLENFINQDLVNAPRTKDEISSILGIDREKIEDILIYYNSKNNNLKISLTDFVNFMNNDVLTNEAYSKRIDDKSRASLNMLSKFTNSKTIKTKMTSSQMASLFGINKNLVDSLYTYYISVNEIDTKLTIHEFSDFVLNEVITDSNYSSLFDENTINSIKMLNTFSNKEIITKNMNSQELSSLLGIEEDSIKQLLFLKYSQTDNGTKLTISEFVNSVLNLKDYLNGMDTSSLEALLQDPDIVSNETKYTATELSTILNMDNMTVYKIYALIDLNQNNTSSWVATPNELVKLLLSNTSSLDSSTIGQLQLVSNIMDSELNNISYTYNQLAEVIGINSQSLKSIYSLYTSKYSTLTLTPVEFVNFVLSHKNDPLLASNLDSSTKSSLNLLQTVMNSVLSNKQFSSSELSNLLGIDKDNLDLLFGLYVSKYVNVNQTISLKQFISFLTNDVMQNPEYSSNFDGESKTKINTIYKIIIDSEKNVKYSKEEIFEIISTLNDSIDKKMVDLLYIYYGSQKNYNEQWTMTVEKFVDYLNDDILKDTRFDDFIEEDMKKDITDAKNTIKFSKKLLIGDEYSRLVLNTKFDLESEETFEFIQMLKDKLGENIKIYVVGDSPMAYEMSKTFNQELNFITILTMIAIFVVVAVTFKSILIPIILVLTIQCAVYTIMGILSFAGEGVYFIALLIVQSILMGATIDYAILYTSYYLEHRKTMNIKDSIINAYNNSIHTILTSASILIIVTLIVGHFTTAITSKICKTISEGTLCSAILILVLLPAVIAAFDKIIIRKTKN